MIELNRQYFRDVLSPLRVAARDTSADAPLMGKVVNGDLILWYDSFEFSIWSIIPDVKGDLNVFSIPLDKIYRILGSWSLDTIKLNSLDDGKLRVSCGRNRITVPFYEGYMSDIEFPPEGKLIGTLPSTIIKSFTEVIPFLSKVEDMSGILSCARLYADGQKISIWGCDKIHMYIRDLEFAGEPFDYLIPMESMDILSKILKRDMTISIYKLDNDFILLETDAGFTVQVVPFNVSNSKYPDLVGILPKDSRDLFTFNYSDMLETFNIINSLDTSKIMSLYSENDDVRVLANESDYDSDLYLEGSKLISDDFEFRINTDFFRHCMEVHSFQKGITCMYSDVSKMVSLRGEDETKQVTVMVYGKTS